MKFTKDDTYGIFGSLGIHLLVLIALSFAMISTKVPEENSGVLVNFGNIDVAAGTFEPLNTGDGVEETVAPPPTPPSETETTEEEMVTQDLEKTVAITDTKKKDEQKKKEEVAKREQERILTEKAEQQRIANEQYKKGQAISNKVAGAFGIGSTPGSSQGTGRSGTGNQGSPFGNSDHGANEGVGGHGSFALSGRSISEAGLPKPAYTIQEEGKIVINITVDPRGNVIFTEIGRGTNIDNASMRRSAIEAARKAKFNSISGTNNQSGTITYKYNLR